MCRRYSKESNKYLCSVFNKLSFESIKDFKLQIPKNIGQGKVTQMESKKGIKVADWHMKFNSNMNVKGTHTTQYINFGFCIKEGISWDIPSIRKNLEVNKGESFIYLGKDLQEHTCYEKEKQFQFIGIKIPKNHYWNIINENFNFEEIRQIENLMKNFSTNKITPSMQKVLAEIVTFNYKDSIGSIFLEGKVMELIAVYFNMIFNSEDFNLSKIRLSKSDIEIIKDAKKIVDSKITNAPSCSELSKLVHLNLSKLCKGFKQIYGKPIYSYIMDERLEKASAMLLQGTYNVSEVATFIGYSNMSHFSAAFRKKYGINPKEFQKIYNK